MLGESAAPPLEYAWSEICKSAKRSSSKGLQRDWGLKNRSTAPTFTILQIYEEDVFPCII